MNSLKHLLKQLAARLLRPGLADIHRRLDLIEIKAFERAAAPPSPVEIHWRGSLQTGRATTPDGAANPAATAKFRDELAYWVNVARGHDPSFPGEFHAVFAGWQRRRLNELADQLKLDGPGFEAWARERTAAEIGGGPHPCVCEARWKRAIAVDPLADGYAAEGLYPDSARHITHLASPGEAIPLPSAIADLVIIENALDHVEDPRAVVTEIARLLRPRGLVWLLVDLMDYRDHMHPSPMSEARLRGLMTEAGFRERYLASWPGASHPMATHQCRSLWEKI
ncbi:MAG: methyltransferase domain-containing protein [Phycisphaerales bacterium]|nr:methyltransferase domain-containing protein [Phycisphaerales bacterium]